MTLDEVLEQVLPHCDDDPFEVAKWVDKHIKKKSGILLLADGVVVSPELYSGHLKIEAKIAPNAKPTLRVLVLRWFGHTERAEAIVGYREIKNELGEPIKNELGEPIKEPIKESYDRPIGPIKQWTVERKSFEANRPDTRRNRSSSVDRPVHAKPGRKPYDWELYKAKFYLMLDDDDVPAHANINVSDYADKLMTWGGKNFGKKKTPEQAAMREKVAVWKLLWERLKNANK